MMKIRFSYIPDNTITELPTPITKKTDPVFIQEFLGSARVEFIGQGGTRLIVFEHTVIDLLANLSVGFSGLENGVVTQGAIFSVDSSEDMLVAFIKEAERYTFSFQKGTRVKIEGKKLSGLLVRFANEVFVSMAKRYPGIEATDGYTIWQNTIAKDLGVPPQRLIDQADSFYDWYN